MCSLLITPVHPCPGLRREARQQLGSFMEIPVLVRHHGKSKTASWPANSLCSRLPNSLTEAKRPILSFLPPALSLRNDNRTMTIIAQYLYTTRFFSKIRRRGQCPQRHRKNFPILDVGVSVCFVIYVSRDLGFVHVLHPASTHRPPLKGGH